MKDFSLRGNDPCKNLNSYDRNFSEGNKSVVAQKRSSHSVPTKNNNHLVQTKLNEEDELGIQMKEDPIADFFAFKDAKQNCNPPNNNNNITQAKLEEEENLPMKKKDEDEEILQRKSKEEVEPLQAKKDEEEKIQIKPTSSSLSSKMPEGVQAKIENSFGTDFSDVNIHSNSDNASNIGALAYTQGKDIHFAPGQYNPQTQSGQELLGHELTHVVQQSQSNIQSTTQMKGLNVNDDDGLEKEADEMGKKAATGNVAEVTKSSNELQRKVEGTTSSNEANKTLFDLETKGASSSTANQDRLGYDGVKASETLAEKDLGRISNYAKIFIEVGNANGIPPALLAAIASRESRAGDGLNNEGYGKFDSHGYGLMQIDTKSGNSNADSVGATSKEHIEMAAKHFKEGWNLIKKKHPDWESAWQLRGAVAAYNFGAKSVQTKGGLDEGSTHDDYSSDIWARARYYATKKEFGGDVNLVKKAEATEVKIIKEANVKSDTAIVDSASTTTISHINVINGKSNEIKSENYYTVESGESLEFISKKFNISIETLINSNESKLKTWGDKKGFNAGEVIAIPGVNVSSVLAKRPPIGKSIEANNKNNKYNKINTVQIPYNPNFKPFNPKEDFKKFNSYLSSNKNKDEVKINLDDVARRVYEAIDGIGTNEDEVISALSSLKHDTKSIDELKKIYLNKYGAALEEDIRGDFSGDELKKALGLINIYKINNSSSESLKKFDKSSFNNNGRYKTKKIGAGETLYGRRQDNKLGYKMKDRSDKSNKNYLDNKKDHAIVFDSETAYYEAVDNFYKNRNEKANTKISIDQNDLLKIARNAAKDESYFQNIINESEKAKNAIIDYSSAMVSYEGLTLSSVLQYRMAKFHKFCVAYGIYKDPVMKIQGNSAMRDRNVAHQYSTQYAIVVSLDKSQLINNFKSMFLDGKYNDGSLIKDKNGNAWAKTSYFVDKDNKSISKESIGKLDSEKTFDNIKNYVKSLPYRKGENQKSIASEGYDPNTPERLPNLNSHSVSAHIYGDALDVPGGGADFGSFINDPIVDFLAFEFGLVRNARNEQWHFQITGKPIKDEEKK